MNLVGLESDTFQKEGHFLNHQANFQQEKKIQELEKKIENLWFVAVDTTRHQYESQTCSAYAR